VFVVWALVVPLVFASYFDAYLRRRRTGQPEGDWRFLSNRRAVLLGIGGAAAIILANVTSGWTVVLAIPPSLIVGALIAMLPDRHGPLCRR